MAQNWRYSSRKAKRELGLQARGRSSRRSRATIEWYTELIEAGAFDRRRAVADVARLAAGCAAAERGGLRVARARRALPRAPARGGRVSRAAFFPRDEYFMRLALREAERALEHDDVPVGCVIAHEGEVIAAAPNERELRGDPTAHCEILALREAARRLGRWRLTRDVLYVTLEPCAMCAGAIVLARVPRVVYGARRPEGRRRRQRARRARRAAPQPPARRGRRPAGRRVRGAPARLLLVTRR